MVSSHFAPRRAQTSGLLGHSLNARWSVVRHDALNKRIIVILPFFDMDQWPLEKQAA